MKTTKGNFILYTRNFIFGAEDSLVSTVGLLAGIVAAGVTKKEVIISGIVLICVEAFSMSVGSFLSEKATEESSTEIKRSKRSNPLLASVIMFLSYFVCGLIPLFPYFIIATGQAFWLSIVASLISLFILGIVSAKILKINIIKNSIRMFLIGGLAICLGVGVGMLIR